MAGGSRRTHSKSRLSCAQCKKRRVKCDCRGPRCGNCERRGEECDYQYHLGLSQAGPVGHLQCSTLSVSKPGQRTLWFPSYSIVASQISSSPKRSAEDALLYHWHTNTSLIISVVKTPEIQAFWQTEAPWLAQSHPFLMHSLAALAGLHLAQLIPDQSQAYLKEARVRQVQASNLFRSWAAGTLEKRNFRVIFAFAVLTMVSYLATEPITGNNSLDLAHFITWVNLFRYPHRLVRSSLFSSNNDPDALAILRPFGEGKPPTQLRDRAMIDSFESLRSANANSTMSSPDSQTLSDSIDVVEKFFEVTPVRPPDLMTTASWMFMLPEDFFTLLTQRTEIAIALMAHCLMPTCNAPPVWLVTKWSKRAAEASLGILGDRWQTRMHWASTEIQSSSAEIYVFGMDYLAIP